jgi:hypothetical protein
LVGADRVPGLEKGLSILANSGEELWRDRGEISNNVLVEETLTLVRCEQLDFGGLPNLRIIHEQDLTAMSGRRVATRSLNHTRDARPVVARGGRTGVDATGGSAT